MAESKPHVLGWPASTGLLLIVAFFGAFFRLVFLSQATAGVGILTACCLLAIVARIAQAAAHHKDMMSK